jgi:flagella basal body P-ring formation protein FlgA
LLEPQRPALRAETVVTGDVVRIGDLIDNAGIVADVPIFRAPDLGSSGTISAARVLEAVRSHALVGIDSGPISEIAVTRASRTVSSHDIESRIIAALTSRHLSVDAKDIALYFERPLRPIYVEPNGTATPRVDRVNYDARAGRFDAMIDIPGPPARQLRVAGVAVVTVPVVTLTRSLARGDIVKASDVALERRPRAETGNDMIAEPQAAVGLAARAALSAGRVLRNSELMKPELIARNDIVTLVYEVPGILVTARGKAGDGGAEGDLIEVTNLQSKRSVHGTITGPGRVLVSQAASRVLKKAENQGEAHQQSNATTAPERAQ